MTRWQEFPLRPQGQAWPGLNTRGGRLDPGTGQLEDGSFNAVINEADILEKRKGLIRGLDERFDGPVCGIFRYTSNCGIEYIVVSDQEGIYVRTPFDIPTFLGSDSLPNDDFNGTLDTSLWTNTDDYQTYLGSLVLSGVEDKLTGEIPETRFMQWFKASALTSYQTEIQYDFVAGGQEQQAAVVLKRNGSTYLLATVTLSPTTYNVSLVLVQSGISSTLDASALSGAGLADGFLRLGYDADSRTVTVRTIPSGGSQVTLTAVLTEAQDANLGQNTAIAMSRIGVEQSEVLQVTGGALGS